MVDISPHPLQAQVTALRIKHQQIKKTLLKLESNQSLNGFAIQRYKKKKMFLKDNIQKLEDEMLPDIIA